MSLLNFFIKIANKELKMPGVLPYIWHNNEVYALLGKEKSGSGANTWCHFSGGKEARDRDNKVAAARECAEETCEQQSKSFPVEITF